MASTIGVGFSSVRPHTFDSGRAFLLVLVVMISTLSCSDLGTVAQVTPAPAPIDCGTFESFRPPAGPGDYYYITGVRVFPLDRLTQNGITYDFYCRVLRGQLAFEIQTEYKRLTQNELSEIPGIVTDPRIGDIVNPIKYTNASMRFDKDIQYRGQVIQAQSNLVGSIPIAVPPFYFPLTISPWTRSQIHLWTSDFTVADGEYRLVVSWETRDNKTIIDTVDFAVKMQQ